MTLKTRVAEPVSES